MKRTESSRDGWRPSQEAIARLAYKFFEGRGRLPGHELEDWLLAEETLRLDEKQALRREPQEQTAI